MLFIITARKRSLGQGNIFSSVCQEFCSQEGSTWVGTPPRQVHPSLGRYTPQAGTAPRQVHPPGRYTPQAGTPTPQAGSPTWAVTPPGQVHPPRQVHPPGRHTHPPGRFTHLGSYTPWAGTPPGRYTPSTPGSSTCWEIRATSGQYASYWNAFLLSVNMLTGPRNLETNHTNV